MFIGFLAAVLFMSHHDQMQKFAQDPASIVVASTGRSGSTMLSYHLEKVTNGRYKILKTHLLPPSYSVNSKIIFIFSNPDHAAESVLHQYLTSKYFASQHHLNMETANKDLFEIGDFKEQDLDHNLLSYDALGTYIHLKTWLEEQTEVSSLEDSEILALKYENLWEQETIDAIKAFLGLPEFYLPTYRHRGYSKENISSKELEMRAKYNLGTDENPIYEAYNSARNLWNHAKPFTFLKIRKNHD